MTEPFTDKLKAKLLSNRTITSSGCWEWTACRSAYGYGRFAINGKDYLAHRIAFELFVDNPGDLFVCHKCDNPPCFNPEHLFKGTPDDNLKDSMSKGRMHWKTYEGEEHPRSKLKAVDVLSIRQKFKPGICTRQMLADEFKVAIGTIDKIIRRTRWACLPTASKGELCPHWKSLTDYCQPCGRINSA